MQKAPDVLAGVGATSTDPPAQLTGQLWHRGGEELLEQHGFKKGETIYIEQMELLLEEDHVG